MTARTRRRQEEYRMKKSEIMNILAGKPRVPKKKVRNLSYPDFGDEYYTPNMAEQLVNDGQFEWFAGEESNIFSRAHTGTRAYKLHYCRRRCNVKYK